MVVDDGIKSSMAGAGRSLRLAYLSLSNQLSVSIPSISWRLVKKPSPPCVGSTSPFDQSTSQSCRSLLIAFAVVCRNGYQH